MSTMVIFGKLVSGEAANAWHALRINAVTILLVQDSVRLICTCLRCLFLPTVQVQPSPLLREQPRAEAVH